MSLPIQPAYDIFTILKKANLSTSIGGKIVECNTAGVTVTSSVLQDGASTSALQITGNDYLNDVVIQTTGINNKLTTANTTLDNIETGINKAVTTAVLYNNATLSGNTTTSTINMGTGKDRYNTIQVIGSSVTNGFDFRFDFSIDGTNWYSDGVFSSHFTNGETYQFAVSRLNISSPYIRIHTGETSGSNVYMSYALSKE
jgi:hypothetical protein